jgi:hypothetical protein
MARDKDTQKDTERDGVMCVQPRITKKLGHQKLEGAGKIDPQSLVK